MLDIVPYSQRQPGPLSASEPERFTEKSWHVGDICDPKIWEPFEDGSFDFVLCTQTLEDLRDPIGVCAQMVRVGKRGYLEVPSRLRECTRERPEIPLAGWNHHRWIVDFVDGELVFTAKMQWAHDFDYAGPHRERILSEYGLQFLGLEWKGDFAFVEHMSKGPVIESENLFRFFATYPFKKRPRPVQRARHRSLLQPRSARRPTPTFRNFTEFKIPIETAEDPQEVLDRYLRRVENQALAVAMASAATDEG